LRWARVIVVLIVKSLKHLARALGVPVTELLE
jgi:hypothetical protein